MSARRNPVSESRLDHVLKVGLSCKDYNCAQTSAILNKNPLVDKCSICLEPLLQKPLDQSALEIELRKPNDQATRFFKNTDEHFEPTGIRPLFVDSYGHMYHLSCAKAYRAAGGTKSPLSNEPWTKKDLEDLQPDKPKQPDNYQFPWSLTRSALLSLVEEGRSIILEQNTRLGATFQQAVDAVMRNADGQLDGVQREFIKDIMEAEGLLKISRYDYNEDLVSRYFEEYTNEGVRQRMEDVERVGQILYIMERQVITTIGEELQRFRSIFMNCLCMGIDSWSFAEYMKLASVNPGGSDGTSYNNAIYAAVQKYIEFVIFYATSGAFQEDTDFEEYIQKVLRVPLDQEVARQRFRNRRR